MSDLKFKFVKKTPISALSTALDISSLAAWLAPDLLKALAVFGILIVFVMKMC